MKIPDKLLHRLSLYHFILNDLREDEEFISSTRFAQLLNIDGSQVRKDLKYLNNQGKCRVGYNARELKQAIEKYLGLKKSKDAFLVGAGNLGTALAKYSGFKDYGLNILALFDNDPKKIGTTVNGKEIFELTKISNLAQRLNVKIAILTVPKQNAQATANYLAGAGIKYIWNFTACVLDVVHDVKVLNENLIGNFLQFTNSYEDTKQ
ncbi:redox-sensing transcriptional repressor Rex [bacterium]|nr:redox-sensing transcriptional repressor Rex [bacterium]